MVPMQSLQTATIATPLGKMVAVASIKGLCLLDYADHPLLARKLAQLKQHFEADIQPGKNPHLQAISEQLNAYFAGQRKGFSVPLVLTGTPFQRAVWQGLQDIPFGATRSYQQQAEALGRPKAVRAVANANGQNRLAIIIPCHRVIGANGRLTGYSGGLFRKRFLLDLESGTSTDIA